MYQKHATAVGAELVVLSEFLCGAGAVRGGTHRDISGVLFGGFLTNATGPSADPLGWEATVVQWRPPGMWLMSDRDRRQVGLSLAVKCLEVLESVTPLEERRHALLRVHGQQRAAGRTSTAKEGVPYGDLVRAWTEACEEDVLAALPDLAGPEGYLGWVYDGFVAAQEQLAASLHASWRRTPPASRYR